MAQKKTYKLSKYVINYQFNTDDFRKQLIVYEKLSRGDDTRPIGMLYKVDKHWKIYGSRETKDYYSLLEGVRTVIEGDMEVTRQVDKTRKLMQEDQ